MDNYVRLIDIPAQLGLKKGDNVFVTSDVKTLLYSLVEHGDETDLNILIDGIIDIIGEEGTLVFPTFNWEFCKGIRYDHYKTKCKTGSLGTLALKRDDFKRTKHPIYSFAVHGKGMEEMCAMDNKSSFGADSPFTYMLEHDFINLFIDKDLEHSFVFVHYVEEQNGPVSYRYLKDFTAEYTDAEGNTSTKTYSMNVRDLDLDVTNRIYLYEPDFLEKGVMKQFYINDIEYKTISLKGAYPIIADDVINNHSYKLCSYIGQDGDIMYDLAKKIFPICRSITGNGVRETLNIFKECIPEMTISEVPSGTQVFDWTIPKEWNIKGAYIEDESGKKIIDFEETNLRVVGYSTPIDAVMSLDELMPHLYSLEEQPDVIPYVTSYYKERWGFCLTDNEKKALKPGNYHVVIDSELKDGSLTYAEMYFPGKSDKEIFFSSYVCHPSMGNNECSGQALMISLANYIKNMKDREYSYRLILVPETIGAITYLSKHYKEMQEKIIAGFNLTCVGDDRTYSIIHSRYGNTLADKVLTNILKYHYPDYDDYSYLKRGSDERQYQAPGIDLPLVCFCRSKYHIYPEYHTSADDLDLISPKGLQGSFDVMTACINALENNAVYQVTNLCEPQLGKRGLIPTISSKETYQQTLAMKDTLAYADGTNDLIELSNIIEQPISVIIPVVKSLLDTGLLIKLEEKKER